MTDRPDSEAPPPEGRRRLWQARKRACEIESTRDAEAREQSKGGKGSSKSKSGKAAAKGKGGKANAKGKGADKGQGGQGGGTTGPR